MVITGSSLSEGLALSSNQIKRFRFICTANADGANADIAQVGAAMFLIPGCQPCLTLLRASMTCAGSMPYALGQVVSQAARIVQDSSDSWMRAPSNALRVYP